MEDLIKITEKNGKQAVSARELHKFVEATERFSSWMKRQFQYGFVENVDYVGCKEFNALANQKLNDYALTLDCAKQVAMLQKNAKGMQARLYFIEVEKKFKQRMALPDFTNPVEAARAWADEVEAKQLAESKVKELKPKAEYADEVLSSEGSFAVTHIAKELGMSAIALNKKLHEMGVQHKVGGTWVLTARYENFGYTRMGTQTNIGRNGEVFTTHHTYWTEKGRKFVHDLFGGFVQTDLAL